MLIDHKQHTWVQEFVNIAIVWDSIFNEILIYQWKYRKVTEHIYAEIQLSLLEIIYKQREQSVLCLLLCINDMYILYTELLPNVAKAALFMERHGLQRCDNGFDSKRFHCMKYLSFFTLLCGSITPDIITWMETKLEEINLKLESLPLLQLIPQQQQINNITDLHYICLECDGWILYRSGIFTSLASLSEYLCQGIFELIPIIPMEFNLEKNIDDFKIDESNTIIDKGELQDIYVKDRIHGWLIRRYFPYTGRIIIAIFDAFQYPSLLEIKKAEQIIFTQLSELALR